MSTESAGGDAVRTEVSIRVIQLRRRFTASTGENKFTEDHDPGSQWNTCCQVRDPWPPTQSLTSSIYMWPLTFVTSTIYLYIWIHYTPPLPKERRSVHIYCRYLYICINELTLKGTPWVFVSLTRRGVQIFYLFIYLFFFKGKNLPEGADQKK